MTFGPEMFGIDAQVKAHLIPNGVTLAEKGRPFSLGKLNAKNELVDFVFTMLVAEFGRRIK